MSLRQVVWIAEPYLTFLNIYITAPLTLQSPILLFCIYMSLRQVIWISLWRIQSHGLVESEYHEPFRRNITGDCSRRFTPPSPSRTHRNYQKPASRQGWGSPQLQQNSKKHVSGRFLTFVKHSAVDSESRWGHQNLRNFFLKDNRIQVAHSSEVQKSFYRVNYPFMESIECEWQSDSSGVVSSW